MAALDRGLWMGKEGELGKVGSAMTLRFGASATGKYVP